MDSIEKYAKIFDESYPDYADSRYGEIKKLVEVYDAPGVPDLIAGEDFKRFAALIRPVIAIKNYKSQIPFPEDVAAVIQCVASIRAAKPLPGDILKVHKVQFEKLLSLQGFQLPTVSAVFHFCHPNDFPIVDINVEAACALLKERYPDALKNIEEPSLPAANTSSKNKAEKYLAFIAFITKVKALQAIHGGQSDFRYIDKALMVLGVLRLRSKVDAIAAR